MLHGDLVTLRAFRPEDLDALSAYQNDVETELLSGGAAPTPSPRESMAEIWERRRNDKGSIDFIIEADDKVIGECGLFNGDPIARTMEFGITVGDKAYWGRGYGSEATRLAVDYGFRFRNLRKIFLHVLANNPRAIAAYGKAGFVEEGRQKQQVWGDGEYLDQVFMGVFRPDA
jgi:RimJ/RimL family protein N-acetyltransferase